MIIKAYQSPNSPVNIDQLPMARDWMDRTVNRHAYQCFPMALANRLGWGISLKEDFSFIWDGKESASPDHIKIIKGAEFMDAGRGNRSISFDTGIYMSPEKNFSILTMPPPNIFIEGLQCITTIVSTSALAGEFAIGLMATIPNKEIFVKAGTIVASLLPISLSEINNTELIVKNRFPDFTTDREWAERFRARDIASIELNYQSKWTHFYRDAVDHEGKPHGEHEAKKIIMKVTRED